MELGFDLRNKGPIGTYWDLSDLLRNKGPIVSMLYAYYCLQDGRRLIWSCEGVSRYYGFLMINKGPIGTYRTYCLNALRLLLLTGGFICSCEGFLAQLKDMFFLC